MFFKQIDFSKYSSLKIGTLIDVCVFENDADINSEFYIIGGAYNLLVSPNPPPLAILGSNFDFIKQESNSLFVGGATLAGRLCSFAKKCNFCGYEFLSHLPGTIGGLIAMNAGLKNYEIFNLVKRIRFASGWIDKSEILHGYRFASLPCAVLEVELEACNSGFLQEHVEEFKKMRVNQPKEPSAGSFFKNPPNDYAGRLIEAVGLKGHKVGGASFSNIHANFLVNMGNATFDDAIALKDLAQKRVFEAFGIKLENEVKIL